MEDSGGAADEYWICVSCTEKVPYGFAHLCPAKTKQDQGVPMYPGQLSMIELNKKLDEINIVIKAIKEKTDKIK